MKSKIRSFNPIEPGSSFIDSLETLLTALKSGFRINSPLDLLLRSGVEILMLLIQKISDEELSLSEDSMEVTPLWGKTIRYNSNLEEFETFFDPLIDVRDEVIVMDPNTGQPNVLLSSNPKYKKKKISAKRLKDPELAQEVLEDMASILAGMVLGKDWKRLVPGHLYRPDANLSHSSSNPPEGKGIDKSNYFYRRRKLQRSRRRNS